MSIVITAAGVQPSDLAPLDEDSARRILIRAREVAPCLPTVAADSEIQKDALAILRGVGQRAQAIANAGVVASQGRNGTTISYRDIKSAFSDEDISGLRFLCGDIGGGRVLPQGSFPTARPLANLWPEGEYS